jgi:hypothetical protein
MPWAEARRLIINATTGARVSVVLSHADQPLSAVPRCARVQSPHPMISRVLSTVPRCARAPPIKIDDFTSRGLEPERCGSPFLIE